MSQRARQLVNVKYRLPHHAKAIKPVVDALLYALAASRLPHRFGKVRNGDNSWYVDVLTSNGVKKRFHLRYRKGPQRVDVNRGYYRPTTLASMTDERDVIRWVASL